MMMNSIPYSQGDNGQSFSLLDPADIFQLYSPRWLLVGRLELDRVDHGQVLLRFCLPAFPGEAEIDPHERAIRDALADAARIVAHEEIFVQTNG